MVIVQCCIRERYGVDKVLKDELFINDLEL